MQNLRLKVEASTGGEPYRTVAIGIRHTDGSTDFPSVSDGESLPREMLEALDRYLETVQLSVGTWNHKVGNTDYQVAFITEPHP